LRGLLRGGVGDDGLLQRFQLLVYPDVPKVWRNVDRRPDEEATRNADAIFQACSDLKPETVGAEDPFQGLETPFLHFAPDAQEIHDEWLGRLMTRLRTGDDAPILVAHLSKFPSLIPGLSAIFHIADVTGGLAEPGPVSASALALALRWADFLEAHALRVYGLALARGEVAARAIANKLLSGALKGPLTARDIYHRGWAGLTDPAEVADGLDLLEDLGWLAGEQLRSGPFGGRPKLRYQINPKISKHAPQGPVKTGRTGATAPRAEGDGTDKTDGTHAASGCDGFDGACEGLS
jgi:hypothetical protein